MNSVSLLKLQHTSVGGVTCSYWKSLGNQRIALLPGVPTLICPISSGRFPELSEGVLRSPFFAIVREIREYEFVSGFSELMVIEFGERAKLEAVTDNEPVLPNFDWPQELMKPIVSSDWLKALLKRYFFERIVCASSQTNCTFFLEKQIVNEVINIAFRSYESRDYLTHKNTLEISKDLEKWTAFIKQNVHRTLSAKELQSFSGLSAAEMSRVFKKTFGVTPLEFHRRARLEEAKKMIDTQRLSVNQAALAFGYSDGVAFRHAFKKEFGTSPKSSSGEG